MLEVERFAIRAPVVSAVEHQHVLHDEAIRLAGVNVLADFVRPRRRPVHHLQVLIGAVDQLRPAGFVQTKDDVAVLAFVCLLDSGVVAGDDGVIVDGDAEARFLGGIEQPVHALGGVGVGVDADGIAGIILRFRHCAARQRQHHGQRQQHRYEFLHYRNASSFEMLFCISDCFYHTTFSLSCKVLICYFHHHLVAFFPFSPMLLDVSGCFVTAYFHELENLRTKNSMGVYFPCCKEP